MKKILIAFAMLALLVSCDVDSVVDSGEKRTETIVSNSYQEIIYVRGDTFGDNSESCLLKKAVDAEILKRVAEGKRVISIGFMDHRYGAYIVFEDVK